MIDQNASLPDDVFEMLPGPAAVMGHAVAVDAERWKRSLDARGLPAAEGTLARPGRLMVTRKDVFDVGDKEPTAWNAIQLFYHSLAWGLGTKAPYLHQRLDSLAAHRQKAEELLVEAWKLVKLGDSIKEAYSVLTTNRGAGRIPWFGPAFSTKFLYFAQGSSENPRHLILDQVVSESIGEDVWPEAPTSGWWPETYVRYCSLLARWADQAEQRLNRARVVRADEIELTLFGRNLAKA